MDKNIDLNINEKEFLVDFILEYAIIGTNDNDVMNKDEIIKSLDILSDKTKATKNANEILESLNDFISDFGRALDGFQDSSNLVADFAIESLKKINEDLDKITESNEYEKLPDIIKELSDYVKKITPQLQSEYQKSKKDVDLELNKKIDIDGEDKDFIYRFISERSNSGLQKERVGKYFSVLDDGSVGDNQSKINLLYEFIDSIGTALNTEIENNALGHEFAAFAENSLNGFEEIKTNLDTISKLQDYDNQTKGLNIISGILKNAVGRLKNAYENANDQNKDQTQNTSVLKMDEDHEEKNISDSIELNKKIDIDLGNFKLNEREKKSLSDLFLSYHDGLNESKIEEYFNALEGKTNGDISLVDTLIDFVGSIESALQDYKAPAGFGYEAKTAELLKKFEGIKDNLNKIANFPDGDAKSRLIEVNIINLCSNIKTLNIQLEEQKKTLTDLRESTIYPSKAAEKIVDDFISLDSKNMANEGNINKVNTFISYLLACANSKLDKIPEEHRDKEIYRMIVKQKNKIEYIREKFLKASNQADYNTSEKITNFLKKFGLLIISSFRGLEKMRTAKKAFMSPLETKRQEDLESAFKALKNELDSKDKNKSDKDIEIV